MTRFLILLGALALTACAIGTKINNVPAVVTPHGAVGAAQLVDRSIAGEIMTATDTSIVMLIAEGRLIEIPADRVRGVDFKPFLQQAARLTEQDLVLLRRVSRFPYGIPAVALDDLLARARQDAIERIEQ